MHFMCLYQNVSFFDGESWLCETKNWDILILLLIDSFFFHYFIQVFYQGKHDQCGKHQ
jgi:uncharacterized membrane protein